MEYVVSLKLVVDREMNGTDSEITMKQVDSELQDKGIKFFFLYILIAKLEGLGVT